MFEQDKRGLISRRRRFVITGVAVVTAFSMTAIGAFPLLATPGSGFSPNSVVLGAFNELNVKADKTGQWDLFLKTKDDTDIGVDRLSVVAGGQSGWHQHAGATLITVTSGMITWTDGVECFKTTYRQGDTFVEPANRPHLVRNETGQSAEFVAVQIRPHGSMGRIDVLVAPDCPS